MANTPYGLSALMEAVNHIDTEALNLDVIGDVVTGTTEGVTFMDAIDAGLLDEDGLDDSEDDVEDDVDPDDPEINKMLDKIDPTDDEDDVDLESLDQALEAYEDEKEKDDKDKKVVYGNGKHVTNDDVRNMIGNPNATFSL